MADNKENGENRTVGDGQEENLIKKDSDTRRGEDERKLSQEESCSQSKRKNKEKEASKGTGSVQNDTERKETKNKERSSSAGTVYLTVLLEEITSFTIKVSSISTVVLFTVIGEAYYILHYTSSLLAGLSFILFTRAINCTKSV